MVHQGEVLQVVVSHHVVVAGGLDVVYQGVVINFVVSHHVVVAGVGLDVVYQGVVLHVVVSHQVVVAVVHQGVVCGVVWVFPISRWQSGAFTSFGTFSLGKGYHEK